MENKWNKIGQAQMHAFMKHFNLKLYRTYRKHYISWRSCELGGRKQQSIYDLKKTNIYIIVMCTAIEK